MWLESEYIQHRFFIQSPAVGAKAMVFCRDENEWLEGEVIAVEKDGDPLNCGGNYNCEFILDSGSFAVGIIANKKIEPPSDLETSIAEY